MQFVIKNPFERLSFLHQFVLMITVVLVAGVVIIATWIGRQIESSAVNRAASIAAVYVESILAGQLHDWSNVGVVGSETHAAFDRVFVDGPLHRKVLRFKLWDAGGKILYSNDHTQLGRRFPVGDRLSRAFAGALQARISDLDDTDNLPERASWPQLLEVYVPVRAGSQGEVIAVAEFYHSMENLGRDIRVAQQRSWVLVIVAAIVVYFSLLALVRRANATILAQQSKLRSHLQQLHVALAENERMREQLRDAGARSTTLNEQFLHRIAADLHDGPAQEIAFALMRFETLTDAVRDSDSARDQPPQDLRKIEEALRSALGDVRNIAAGLALPGIENLSLADTSRRAVADFERLFGQAASTDIDDGLDKAPIAVKIAVFRLLQESLANSWRHAPDGLPHVHVWREGQQVRVEISDRGAGFDPSSVAESTRLGLRFMRERVRLLGGSFEIESSPGRGTSVRASLPLIPDETTDD